MKLSTQRKIDRLIGSFLCWIFSFFRNKRKLSSHNEEVNRILIILLSEMGSLILAQPMIQHLKKKYPKALIHFLLFEQNKEILELFQVIPSENIYSISNLSFFSLLKDSVRVVFQIKRQKIDIVIDCELFARISSIFSYLSGARTIAGFHPHTQEGLYRGDFVNRPVLYNSYIHISKQFINLVEAIESDEYPTVKRPMGKTSLHLPSIDFNKDTLNNYKIQIEKNFPVVLDKKLILIYPGGGLLPIRAWPLKYYAHLAKNLIRSKFCVGIIGLKQDKRLAIEINSSVKSDLLIDLVGYTHSIKELLMLFHVASLLITNDGGPGQLAALTPIPAITLFGPETPKLYSSLSPNAENIYTHFSCSPCLTAYNHRNSPCNGNNLCLKQIKPEIIIEIARKYICERSA